MTAHVAFNALVGLALMLAVGAVYLLLARRFRVLWHPLSIVVAVGTVSVVVAVLGELLFREGREGVPAMVRRSAIGGFGWGVIIALVVWAGRRALRWRIKRT
jgi:multidrug efflux pump subunit AcrB